MSIKKVKIKNFKCFKDWFEVNFNDCLNILVGNNEEGKSTILEAINIALTGIYRGKYIKNELSQYLFNKEIVNKYLEDIKNGKVAILPEIIIEIYFDGQNHPELLGDGNSDNSKDIEGIVFSLKFDDRFSKEYDAMTKSEIKSLPIEYYEVSWQTFARDIITPRMIPVKSSMIDSSNYKFVNGSDMYISRIVKNLLDESEIVGISKAHRMMKDAFGDDQIIKDINKKLSTSVSYPDKKFALSVDLGTKNSWENSLVTELDEIPYSNIGQGAQCIIKTKLALGDKKTENREIILLEEPECHLSYSNLNIFLNSIKDKCSSKQIIISTHSSFVANKLGLENLILLNDSKISRLSDLPEDTNKFFRKISGYDTLRLILSKSAILVEGDSDELVVQKAYMDTHDGKLPIEDGIDVISVGVSFLRFLEIADRLNKQVAVITDNDGNIKALENKYKHYIKDNKKPNIGIFFDDDVHPYSGNIEKYNNNTLEPCLLRSNKLEQMNLILEKKFSSEDDLLKYMYNKKTECAIKLFDYNGKIIYPNYIERAVKSFE